MNTKHPNILFLFPDQFRFDWLSIYGSHVRTPNLDALAARGLRFTNAITPSPLCAPARACLASGKEYERCGVPNNNYDYQASEHDTLYKLMRDGGYHVIGCGKFDLHKATLNWAIDGKNKIDEWGFSDGIDNAGKIDAIRSGAEQPRDPYMAHLHKKDLAAAHVKDMSGRGRATYPTPLPDESYCDNWLAKQGINLIDNAPDDKPWFLTVNFTGPHDPFDITKSMETSCRNLNPPLPCETSENSYTEDEHRAIRQNYSAMVENIDRWVGIYIDKLRQRRELDNTLIVFSSDHGEMLGDHDSWGKSNYHQPSIGVPMIAAGPGVKKGQINNSPVSVLDLYATFLDYAQVDIPKSVDSVSLAPVLKGETESVKQVAFSGLEKWRVAFDGQYKLVVDQNSDAQELVLFDLSNDPHESKNIANVQAQEVIRLREMINEGSKKLPLLLGEGWGGRRKRRF